MCTSAVRLASVALACALVWTARADAQSLSGRVAVEAIASATAEGRAVDDPAIILDLVGTIRLAENLDLVVRPWSRRHFGGEWMFEMYQLQMRYVSQTRVPFRVDAGIMPSPVGLFTLELQPHRSPFAGGPAYYFSPLPPADGAKDRLRLISGGYPLGAMVSVSGAHWDARAGVTDSSPVAPRYVFAEDAPPAHAQLVVGGGITPIVGMRFGFGLTHGDYTSATTSALGAPLPSRSATVFNLEGEYAFGYTRLVGEWIRNRFDTIAGEAVARGFALQAQQTLTPRVFAAARATRVSSPTTTVPANVMRSFTAFETTLGYRLTPEWTVRGGYQRERGYRDTSWSDAAVLSLVWAERWW